MRRVSHTGLFCCAALLILTFPGLVKAQDQSRGFVVRLHRDEQGTLHKYVLFVPHGYTPDQQWPAILYLHGAGECGTDGLKPTAMGIGPYVKEREANFPFFVLFPQCEDQSGRILTRWNPDTADSQRALKILEEVQKQYSIDSKRMILTGWSMGGYGAWNHWVADPQRWSAVVPIAGGMLDPTLLTKDPAKLQGSRIWAFHGALDNLIHNKESVRVIEALKQTPAQVTYTELPNGDHGIWRQIYASDELYRWMKAPESTPNPEAVTSIPLTTVVPPGPYAPALSNQPFINALYLPKAITVRLGNDSLAAVSDAIPGMVPQETLSGQLGDMYDSTTASGRTFSVRMSGISYSTVLHRVQLEARNSGEVSLKIGLKHILMRIGGTYISGGPRAASVGPIDITVGTQQPVWLLVRAKPRVEAGKIRFDLTNVGFEIQDNNWNYTEPGGIATKGIGMTQDRVYDGVMSGMARSKTRIESQVKSLIPSLVQQLEERIEFSQFDQLIAGMWPLPIVMPRVLTWAEEIKVDDNGITLSLGATVGAVTEAQKKAKPRWAKFKSTKSLELSRERSLFVGINPQILGPISEMAIEAGEAKINVLDTPSRNLASLSDLETMAQLIPDLAGKQSEIELSSDLILRKAVGFTPVELTGSAVNSGPSAKPGVHGSTKLAVDVPELVVRVSSRPRSGKTPWKPYAELVMSMRQEAVVELEKPDFRTRVLQMKWLDSPEIQADAKFAEDISGKEDSIDEKKWMQVVLDGWYEFTDAGHAARMVIPDVQVGVARLRASRLRDDGGLLGVAFGAPPLFIANKTDAPLRYETKILSSDWSTNYTLKPGERARFDVPTDMLIRLHARNQVNQFNLPAGSSNIYQSASPGSPPTLYSETLQENVPLDGTIPGTEVSISREHPPTSGETAPPPPAE